MNELPSVDGAAAHVFLNSGAIECINKYGGFYITKKDDDITIFGIPSKISSEVMPCLNIFRYMSYLKSKTHDFGCYTVGVNIKKNVIFPVIFE
ncbi:hypothetical protein SDC9_192451 [bioreactor metagenome]|uniref:Uncharacterized protein n=1 Tax=bioreactor metagenome TaxID=1076179 RepID=A0A645I993_9ZZZZ